MQVLNELFEKNKNWVTKITDEDPQFFTQLAKDQKPEYLWIGCADSRVPPNLIVDLPPGEIFVHRNIANLVVHTDLNFLSVMQYAVDVLKVKHIVVCGHYGCGGVKAALGDHQYGLIDNWLRHIKDVYNRYVEEINSLQDEEAKFRLLCEKNVIEQVTNVCNTTIVQNTWKSGRELSVHGLIYDIADGMLKDLEVCTTGQEQIGSAYKMV
ncbi:carbonate dehydratase [Candidatus Halobeggiatoa sp. HSG11]|nr:carbonate dehydratase [Candidatus Halobeggiatoa sp. HSG11]